MSTSAVAIDASAGAARRTDWLGHPAGLTILFLTEMWEKFSYFGMRALLIYYMTKGLAIPQERASLIYGSYTAFAYFTPIVGGVIADRLLGRQRAVILGGSIMALGHFLMAFEHLFYPALVTIALGNGLFLPSLPSQVNALYRPDDARRHSAFNVYYVGVNLGAVLAPLVCGTLGELLGWHWGFGAAGVGMCLGLAIYIMGSRYLPDTSLRAVERSAASSGADDASFARRVLLLLAVIAIVVVFRGAYEQIGNTVALWIDGTVDRSISATAEIPSTWFQALNPLLVFALTPLLLLVWTRRARSGVTVAPLRRMACGALIVAAAFLLLATIAYLTTAANTTAPWPWLIAFFVIYTTGELLILPTGLALFGRLAPLRLAATAIAFWFSASFAGNLFAGALGSFWSAMSNASFFALMAGVAASAAALLALLDRYTFTLLQDSPPPVTARNPP